MYLKQKLKIINTSLAIVNDKLPAIFESKIIDCFQIYILLVILGEFKPKLMDFIRNVS